jgi:predicted  nucleic acid-binding Zn-ribbon protein
MSGDFHSKEEKEKLEQRISAIEIALASYVEKDKTTRLRYLKSMEVPYLNSYLPFTIKELKEEKRQLNEEKRQLNEKELQLNEEKRQLNELLLRATPYGKDLLIFGNLLTSTLAAPNASLPGKID